MSLSQPAVLSPSVMTPQLSTFLLDKTSILAPQLAQIVVQNEQHHQPAQQEHLVDPHHGRHHRRSLRSSNASVDHDFCPGIENLLGIRDTIMGRAGSSSAPPPADDFLLCKCTTTAGAGTDSTNNSRETSSVAPTVSITCLFPTVCDTRADEEEGDMEECASLTLSFDFDGQTSSLHAGACIDYSSDDSLEETCIGLDFSILQVVEEMDATLVLQDQCQATYGGETCHLCDVDTTEFCMNMDCSELNEAVITDGCQPLGISKGDLDPTKFIPSFAKKKEVGTSVEGDSTDENDVATESSNLPIADHSGAPGGDGLSGARLSLSNSVVFLFNLMRHYIL